MSDRIYTSPSRPRETERFAELSDLLGDTDPTATIAPGNLSKNANETASLENVFANVDASYPLRPREVSLAVPAAARSWQATPGSFSRATPVAVPFVPGPFDTWEMRPTAGTGLPTNADALFPQIANSAAPTIAMPEPNSSAELSDEDAFQSVLDGLEGDLFDDEELEKFVEPTPEFFAVEDQGSVHINPTQPFDLFIPEQAQVPVETFSPKVFVDGQVARPFDPVSDFEVAFADSTFDVASDAADEGAFASEYTEPKFVEDKPGETEFVEFEDLSSGLSQGVEAGFASQETILPAHAYVASAAIAVSATRANASREIITESTTMPASALPAATGSATISTPALTDMASPYEEVPVTGSLIVPEFVASEAVAAQNTADFDDFDIHDFDTPAPRSQFNAGQQQVVVHEQPQQASAENFVDERDDANFDAVFDDNFNPTDELANVVGNNANDSDLASGFKDENFAPIPALPPVVAPNTGRGKWFAAGALGIALVGALVVYSGIGSGSNDSEAPALVRADNEPVRVAPINPEGTVVPNQDRVVFNQVGGGAAVPEKPQETLVDGRQEPAISVTPVKEEDRVLIGDNSAEANAGNGTAIAPRAVQTVTVRPDGTLVANQPVEQSAAPQAEVVPETRPEVASEPIAPQPMPQPTVAEAANEPVAEVAVAPVNEASQTNVPARVVELKPVVQKQKAVTPNPLDAVPSRPSDQPVNIVNNDAPVLPDQPSEQQSAAVEPAPAFAAGSYLIQIASTPTEESATATLRSLSSKFGSVLGGKDYAIQKADVPGKGTVYRVRILAGTKDEANKLCTRYKSAGGSCFVTR